MQQIQKIIKEYLEMQTNFAIMISGTWGSGKSYYYKNYVNDLIKNTETYNDASKKYKSIIISLFGIKSIEDLETQIFLSLYPFLKNKKFKLGASVGKVIAKGILTVKGLGEYSTILDNAKVKGENFISFANLVICFDDLERISKNLELEEVIGFVNNLVENENAKVILIANEDKVAQENYKELKEKVVGNTLEFTPDPAKSTKSIINGFFTGYQTYQKFLHSNEDTILTIFFKNSNNLRTLVYALSYFQKIFSNFELEVNDHKILQKYKDEILIKLLKFTLAISIEYKNGLINYKNRENLDINNLTALEQINIQNLITKNYNTAPPEEIKDFKDTFIEKYYSNEKFKFFESIYNFLTGGNTFKLEHLLQELNEVYHVVDDEIPEQYQLYRQLSYPDVYKLSDEEYRTKTDELKRFAEKGLYKINEYLTIFYFLTRFYNPLKYELQELVNILKTGIDISVDRNEKIFLFDLDFHLSISDDNENKGFLSQLRAYILSKNEQINIENDYSDLKKLENLFYEDFDEFEKVTFNTESKYLYSALFTNFEAKKLCDYFVKSHNDEKWKVYRFFRMRYKGSSTIFRKEELPFFEELSNCLSLVESGNSGLSSYISIEFDKIISEIKEKLK